MKKLLLFLLVFLLSTLVSAQVLTKFSETKPEFYNELVGLIEEQDKQFSKDILEGKFQGIWNSNNVSSDEAAKFIEIGNLLLKKRLKPIPYVANIVETFTWLKQSNSPSNFGHWMASMKKLAKGSSKSKLTDYITSSHSFLTSGVVYSSQAVTWRTDGGGVALDGTNFICNNVKLSALAKNDSIVIYETTGIYDPLTEKWDGKEGKVTWSRVALDAKKNFATLNEYQVKMKSAFFDADEVELTSEFFPTPIKGKLREKIIASKNPENSHYPAFDSYDRNLEIKNIHPDVDYVGGFSLNGREFSGLGEPNKPSKLVFNRNGKPFIIASSIAFTINDRFINAEVANIVIRHKEDSLSHSGVILKFNKEKNELSLIRGEDGITSGPYSSSFHQMDMYAKKVWWQMGTDSIYLGTTRGAADKVAFFESTNFFVKERYKALAGPGETNPLLVFKGFSNKMRSLTFELAHFADYARITKESAIVMAINIANKGFIEYDINTEIVTVKRKMFDFILANNGRIDFDVIFMKSIIPKNEEVNAVLAIDNFDLSIDGVSRVMLSDSQAVEIFANGQQNFLTVKQNRHMLFNGVVKAGNFDFYGDSFYFNYDEFKIDFIKVDSARLYVIRDNEETGEKKFVPIQTELHNIVGELFIDNPLNKSGMNSDNAEYPILITREPSYTYYDKKSVHDGVYDRKGFYFKIDPFMVDSLDSFDDSKMRFQGNLVSAGIFPDIRDSLKMMEDFSLGFSHGTPENGLPMYGDKAIFTNEIELSNNGLKGEGDIEYVTSVSQSKNFYFFPDSTTAVAQSIVNRKQEAGPDVPDFVGKDFNFELLPKKDKLLAKSIVAPFIMFNKEANQSGVLALSPNGLKGSGKLRAFDAILTSAEYRFNNANAFSDTARFDLKDVHNDSLLAISTSNVKAHIDFSYREGNFQSNAPFSSIIAFPKNKYAGVMDKYKWLIDDKLIEFTSTNQPTDLFPWASHLISQEPSQDSLMIYAPKAIYNIESYTIAAEQVDKILVGDANVHPYQGKVNIEPNAVITPLENARIVADWINKFHQIFEAKVDIKGRWEYYGSGNYNYVDEFGEKQIVAFENIAIDTGRHTFAKGNIPEEQNFKLNAYFDYKGDVMLKAEEKGLNFEGTARILTECANFEREWLFFKGQVDPANAIIPIGTKMLNDTGEKLAAGIMMNKGTGPYASFISKPVNTVDLPVAIATNYLWYEKELEAYRIGSKSWSNGDEEGNVVTLNTKTCDIATQGEFTTGIDWGQVSITGFGSGRFEAESLECTLNGVLMLDFYADEKLLEMGGAKAKDFPFLQPVDLAAGEYLAAVNNYCDGKKAETAIKDLTEKGLLEKIPDCIKKSIVMADCKLRFDTAQNAFFSKGYIGFASIAGEQVFASTRANLMLQSSRRGAEMGLYYEWDPSLWYYFRYKFDATPRMQLYGSDPLYLETLSLIKEKDRAMDTKKNEPSYIYEIAARTSKDAFLEKVSKSKR